MLHSLRLRPQAILSQKHSSCCVHAGGSIRGQEPAVTQDVLDPSMQSMQPVQMLRLLTSRAMFGCQMAQILR